MRLFPISVPGPRKTTPLATARAAFTLIEILLVVALLGFIGAAFVNSAADLFRSREPRADDAFWDAVTHARQLALEGNRIVTLRYDAEKRVLAWSAGADPARTLPYPGKLLEFLPVTTGGVVLLGGQLTETDSIKSVRFYPDGCCDGFRIQITDAAGRLTVQGIDPWTCAPMLVSLSK